MDQRYIAEDRAWADWKTELAFARRCGGISVMLWLAGRAKDFFEASDE